MDTNRKSYKIKNEVGFSILVIILGFGLFLILSIILILFEIFSWFDLWNTKSDWYPLFKNTKVYLIFLPYVFTIFFYLTRFMENLEDIISSRSLKISYQYPSFFGSQKFRIIMWLFFFIHINLHSWKPTIEIYTVPYSGSSLGHALLFCIILILISHLIERDNNSDKGDIPEDTKLSE